MSFRDGGAVGEHRAWEKPSTRDLMELVAESERKPMNKTVRKTKAILKELMPKFGMTDWTVELAGNTTEELAIAMETLGVAYLAMSIANPAVKHLTVRINVEVHRSDSELRQTILHELFHAAAADVGMDEDKITASGQHDRWEAMMDRLSWIAQRLEGGTV